jgi:hypothetical protein
MDSFAPEFRVLWLEEAEEPVVEVAPVPTPAAAAAHDLTLEELAEHVAAARKVL